MSDQVNGIKATQNQADIAGFTSREVAEGIGISVVSLARWRKAGLVNPARFQQGESFFFVYSPEDVEVCWHLRETIKAGRPRKGDEGVRVSHKHPAKTIRTIKRRKIVRKTSATQKDAGEKGSAA